MPSLPSLFRRRPSPPSPPLLELQDLGSAIIEGAEYVPEPRKPADKVAYYPDISKIQGGADNQSQSRFFNILPVEVRQLIYQDIWALSGLTQHIYIANGSYTHCPCLIDHNAPDKRQTELDLLWPELPRVGHGDFRSESPEWRRRLLSTWCNHWPCEEAAARNATSEAAPSSSFLPMLLTSRKMYIECRASIFEHVTFTICSIPLAYDFFVSRSPPIIHEMRLINMSFILHTHWFEAEEDVPRDPDMILHRPESDMWKSLQQGLGTLQSLTELIIWIDCYDERCCEPLFSVPSLFEIGTGTSPTPKTTFILPAREEQHFDKLKDGISVIKRGEPKFHGDIDSHPYDCVSTT
ncbi:hypothetical protein G7054_g7398 [Neopestalotiopsis clavispora]|nr:hypothetical protein G7054_g7398 [Neopestalotiopsis clavispora]